MANWTNSNKRLQSALELLTTYGFMLALAALVIIILFYFATPATQIVPATCNIYGSVSCTGLLYYANTVTNNANVLIFLSNSGSAPANVVGINVIINGAAQLSDSCEANLAYPAGNTVILPGGNTLCIATISPSAQIGKEVTGQFSVNVMLCNSGVGQFSPSTCSFMQAPTTGTFLAYSNPRPYNVPT